MDMIKIYILIVGKPENLFRYLVLEKYWSLVIVLNWKIGYDIFPDGSQDWRETNVSVGGKCDQVLIQGVFFTGPP